MSWIITWLDYCDMIMIIMMWSDALLSSWCIVTIEFALVYTYPAAAPACYGQSHLRRGGCTVRPSIGAASTGATGRRGRLRPAKTPFGTPTLAPLALFDTLRRARKGQSGACPFARTQRIKQPPQWKTCHGTASRVVRQHTGPGRFYCHFCHYCHYY